MADFREAIINLIETEKFLSAENFNLVEAIVSRAKRYEFLRKKFLREKRTVGCQDCFNGEIHFLQDDYEVMAYCRTCYPERSGTADPKIPRQYMRGFEPWNNQSDKFIAPHILKDMLKDLVDKIMDSTTDWKKEVETANKMHEQSQASH